MNEKMYFLITFGAPERTGLEPVVNGEQLQFEGEITQFPYKREIDTYILENGITMHNEANLSSFGFGRRADGRSCIIILGTVKSLQQKCSIL